MINDVTYLGKVINVDSYNVEVELSKDIPSSAPLINGRVYRIGQIGTLIKIPVGIITLYGIVSSISNLPNKVVENTLMADYGSRYLQIQLIGEKIGNEKFDKGIGTYPTINDEVHLVTEDDLHIIYGGKEKGYLEIGKHSSSNNLAIYIDLKNLVLRHSAILGSTGSGKSNTVANILKSIVKEYIGSRIILVDPHGEYESAFQNNAQVFKIGGAACPLHIPFWAMTFDELAFFLVGRQPGDERPEAKRLREKILELKQKNASKLKCGSLDVETITVDSPIPFDIRQLWYDFDRELNATYSDTSKQDSITEELIEEGNPNKLVAAKFRPYSPTNTAPYKSKNQTMYPYLGKIYSRLCDSRFDFMFNPGKYYDPESGEDMDELLKSWIQHEKKLSILDLSGIPFELLDISVGLITRVIFDSMYWGRHEDYTGRNRPLLMVFEEAHSYLPQHEISSYIYGYAKKAVEKVFKEGRKFGVGAMVISQRPSEISQTILSQVGTLIALRLTNSKDKGMVQSVAPNNMTSLIELLPSLRVGEAIVVGESIKIPTRVRIGLVSPRPDSKDPELVECWGKNHETLAGQYKKVINEWRQQKR